MLTETDYLVIGSGASAMAFVDTLLTETEATVAMVDRRHVPGGHWNDAYPFVRLHQPSSFYGVASQPLGRDRKDVIGLNQGFYELASGVEVTSYFHQVMDDVFLPSGRVRYLPSHDYHPDRGVHSLLSGEAIELTWSTVVDATLLSTSIPMLHTRRFDVADGVACEPPNHLPRLASQHRSIAVLGAGKTAIDCVTWLLGNGYPAEQITWVAPRDSWLINRAHLQPGMENYEATIGGLAEQVEICAQSSSVDELCRRHEKAGLWLRVDPDVEPSMFHSATISERELAEMRRVGRVLRHGRVAAIEPDLLVFANGEEVAVEPGTLHVDCTASAAAENVGHREPVFAPGEINLQMVRPFQPCFSAALLAKIEASVAPGERAQYALPTPMTDTVHDWLTVQADGLRNGAAWSFAPELAEWLGECRLNGFGQMVRGIEEDDAKRALFMRLVGSTGAAIDNLDKLASASTS
ncbi:MAG: NAD(P)/FAD-dependent oxidoreductase [Actinomycetota bacterium]